VGVEVEKVGGGGQWWAKIFDVRFFFERENERSCRPIFVVSEEWEELKRRRIAHAPKASGCLSAKREPEGPQVAERTRRRGYLMLASLATA